ncbi:MAG: hypothetical protein ABW152_17890 [Candidatus Thiodiazotropha endolucinida]
MIRLILLTILLLTSTFVNAGQKDYFYSVSLSYVDSDLGKPEGILDTDTDFRAVEGGGTASEQEFNMDSSTRYGITVTRGAFLTEPSHWLSDFGIDVFGEIGGFIHPNYFVEGDGVNENSHFEMNLETFGFLAAIGVQKDDFSIKGGLNIANTEIEYSFWRVQADAPNGLYESHRQINDWSTGFMAEIEYRIFEDLFISFAHIDAIGSKNWTGISSANEIRVKARFR